MRFRAYVLAAAVLSMSFQARAQGSSRDGVAERLPSGALSRPDPRPVSNAALPRQPEAPHFIGAEQFFAGPWLLGDAWSRAVGAVLDTMKRLADLERITEGRVLRAPVPASSWQVAPSPLEPTPTTRMVAFTPLPVEPVTEAIVDTRGEHAMLLGGQVTLPWMVP